MKRTIPVVLFLLLLAGVARADGGTLEVSATADYLIQGQQVDVSFSYQLTSPAAIGTNVIFAISGAQGPFTLLGNNGYSMQWSNDPNFNSEITPNAGDVSFFTLLEGGFSPGDFIDLEMYAPGNYDFGGYLPVSFSESVTDPVATPEPAEAILLLVSLATLYGFTRLRKYE